MSLTRGIMIALLLAASHSASANLIGEEITYQRITQDGKNPALPDDATFIAGPGIDFTQAFGSYEIDISDDSIRFECIRESGCAFGNSPPHEMRFFIPLPILGTTVESQDIPGFNAGNVSFTRHKLTVDVNGLTGIADGGFFEVTVNLGAPAKAVPLWSPLSITLLALGLFAIFAWHHRASSKPS